MLVAPNLAPSGFMDLDKAKKYVHYKRWPIYQKWINCVSFQATSHRVYNMSFATIHEVPWPVDEEI